MVKILSDPWWKSTAYFVWWIFTRIGAPMMAILLPVLVVYGFISADPASLAPLNLKRSEVALFVGYAGGEACLYGHPCNTYQQHSYIVIPRVFSNGATISVNDNNGVVTVTEDNGDALITIALWLLCVYGLWYFWVRSIFKRRIQSAS